MFVICHSAFDSKFEKKKGGHAGKEQSKRIDREILICDPEEVCRDFADSFFEKKGRQQSANLFVAGNGTGVTEDWSDIKVLLISEDVPYEKTEFYRKIILARQHCVDLEREKQSFGNISRLTD